jgi:hypothetical protein
MNANDLINGEWVEMVELPDERTPERIAPTVGDCYKFVDGKPVYVSNPKSVTGGDVYMATTIVHTISTAKAVLVNVDWPL